MSPGSYLRHAREASGLTLEDLALRLDSDPPVSCRARIEWLARIEAGIDPLGCVTALALARVKDLRLDRDTLAILIDAAQGADLTVRLRAAVAIGAAA